MRTYSRAGKSHRSGSEIIQMGPFLRPCCVDFICTSRFSRSGCDSRMLRKPRTMWGDVIWHVCTWFFMFVCLDVSFVARHSTPEQNHACLNLLRSIWNAGYFNTPERFSTFFIYRTNKIKCVIFGTFTVMQHLCEMGEHCWEFRRVLITKEIDNDHVSLPNLKNLLRIHQHGKWF